MAKVRRSPQQWQQLIEAQHASALTIEQFCAEHQLTVSNFYLQRKKYREQSVDKGKKVESWLPLNALMQVQEAERDWHIELKLPNGVVLNMHTATEH